MKPIKDVYWIEVEKETEDTALLDKLETLPDKKQKDIWRAATYTGCSLKEVMKIKGIIP